MSSLFAYTCPCCGHQGKAINGLRRCIQCREMVIVLKQEPLTNSLNQMVAEKVFGYKIGRLGRGEELPGNYAGDIRWARQVIQVLESRGFEFSTGIQPNGLLYACFSDGESTHWAQSASMAAAICKAGIDACGLRKTGN